MEVLQNRAVAVLLSAVVVIFSTLACGGASLSALRAQTEAVFAPVGSGVVASIQSDLTELAAQCYNITVIASRYLPGDDAAIAGALEKRDSLLGALHMEATPREKHRAAEEMVSAASKVLLSLEGMNLSSQDKNLLASCRVEIDSRLALIASNRYNGEAAAFNRTLESFPANILGRATGVSPLELYE